ncbi:E4 [Macaca fascicularis papillomavirus 2]|uniref:E4 n=1 Tax=Macaca fascicularis papillomavirus 2 TaxID=915424 RepID=F8QPP8_9PAPI|nr:E4 [Macaca fascicularis papillomavirus 2]ADQ39303.1 E4 [Macaca fascicularis papillomavirus 2]
MLHLGLMQRDMVKLDFGRLSIIRTLSLLLSPVQRRRDRDHQPPPTPTPQKDPNTPLKWYQSIRPPPLPPQPPLPPLNSEPEGTGEKPPVQEEENEDTRPSKKTKENGDHTSGDGEKEGGDPDPGPVPHPDPDPDPDPEPEPEPDPNPQPQPIPAPDPDLDPGQVASFLEGVASYLHRWEVGYQQLVKDIKEDLDNYWLKLQTPQ